MNKNYFILLLLSALCMQAGAQTSNDYASAKKEKKQKGRQLGIRGGYNIPRMAGEKNMDLKPGTKNGYTFSLSYSPASRSGMGFRSELVYSSQNFSFSADGQKTAIKQEYIYLPQFTTIGISKFFQLQVGGQIGFLLNANRSSGGKSKESLLSAMNRLDYGAAGGLEVYPFKGIIIGGRYNMNFGKTYKAPTGTFNPLPFNPSDVKGSNAVINFYLGYKF
ncbi:MAG: outer membrane beta-barrel protein [Chitinophagaceae bacterium]